MDESKTQASLQDILSRQQISTLVVRLARAMDRNDRDGITSSYHPGALDHHGEFDGPVEQLVVWVDSLHRERLESMSHLITNHYVELNGDKALGETYVTAVLRTRRVAGRQFDLSAVGRYLDRYERRDGGWRIAERTVVLDWQRMDSVPSNDGVVVDISLRGQSSKSDPSYQHFRNQHNETE